MRPRPASVLLALCATALAPASAHAVAFGANLANATANSNPSTTCAQAPPDYFSPTGSGSCQWTDFNLTPPASGTVGTIQVKVGSVTGPMRVNVVRFLFQQTGDPAKPSSAGPFLERYGPEFTPAANATTKVTVNLPVREDPTPPASDTQTIQVIDVLALEVRSSGVPFPFYRGSGSLSYFTYPGPTARGIIAPSANAIPTQLTYDYGVLLQGDLVPTSTGGAADVPQITLPASAQRVRDGAVRVPLRCTGADCAGTIALLPAATVAAARAAKGVTYGSASFAIREGATKRVRIKLSKRGRALLKRKRRAVVSARIRFTKGALKGRSATLQLKLRR